MNIKKNLKIKGSPGTLLEIRNGFILINENTHVSFSECSFVFNYEQSIFIEKLNSGNEKYSKILKNRTEKTFYNISCIKICENSQLEINDCDFRSIVHESEEIFEDESKLIRETLIDCEFSSENVSNNKAKLCLNSSIFSNFSSIIAANFLKNISVDNCHFSEISNVAFAVMNFVEFSLENSIITNAADNAVEIFDCDAIKALLKIKVLVKIKNCQIYSNEKNAIVLRNNNNFNQNINKKIDGDEDYSKINNNNALRHLSNKRNATFDLVEITKNKIFQNKGIGIIIDNYNHKTFEIIENQIEKNLLGNILINNLSKFEQYSYICSLSSKDTDSLLAQNTVSNADIIENFKSSNNPFGAVNYSEFNLILLKNDIKNSYSAFGLKMQNCTNIKILIEHNQMEKNLIGMQIINNKSTFLFVKSTNICSNLDSGVVLLDNKAKSNFNFIECRINKNYNYGIQVNNNANLNSLNFNNYKGIANETHNNEIKIFKGEINLNNIGLGFESFLCKIDRCRFIDNKSFAVQINEERLKENLKLFNYEKNLNKMVNSPIGGSWGIFNNDKCICHPRKCLIF
jgi:hypothetical protein